MNAAANGIDTQKVEQFLGQFVGDAGAAYSIVLANIGDKLGLYKAMAGAGPLTSQQLAERTGTHERYLREWLINQAAGGYVTYDSEAKAYTLPDEHAVALADENSPYFIGGAFQSFAALSKAEDRITNAMRSGGGLLWGDHHHDLFEGTERFFRSGYIAHLVEDWIPALDGVSEKLQRGAKVADVGCGHGASTIILAKAYPNSRFYGFDNHAPSIERARRSAEEAGVADRVTFEIADATSFPGEDYDLIAYFDCYHDLGDPAGSAKCSYEALARDGTVMIVEPMAGETVEGNFNPVGRVYAAASVLCCTPNAIASGGPALGTVAADSALREQVEAGGFTQFRRATETPFNRVFEAKR